MRLRGDVGLSGQRHAPLAQERRRGEHPGGRVRKRLSPGGGDRVRVVPAHVDPTVSQHERLHLVDGDEVIEVWEVDLRGW